MWIKLPASSYTLTGLPPVGDWMRTSSPYLEKVINAGIRTVIYDGDADYICNYQGVENMVNALKHKYSAEYASTSWTSWTIDGVTAGQFKNAGLFSYVRIYRCVSHFLKPHPWNSPLPGLVTWSPPTPLETCLTGSTPSPCSPRRWPNSQLPRRKPRD